ncbi:hypothetical protein B0T17DRAFT_611279 [Bombardia bombarda]|uniref:N-acetyltransferase domain-containing protein n=1 Tax=Bombardia bombarda TaxID=252184 RepID=A0AA39XHS2_9PEZI|nr:hypothetical protein B0T17DRAFT_611279 [Bombardia bombarda]
MPPSNTATIRPSHTITTPRLTIRTTVPADAPGIAALRSHPANNPYTKPDSPDPAAYLERMRQWHAATAEGRSAFMVILLHPTPDTASESNEPEGLVGFGGFNEFRWLGDDSETQELEADIGGQIDHAYWRRPSSLWGPHTAHK